MSLLGKILPSRGNRGTYKLFSRSDIIMRTLPAANMTVECPDLGPTGSNVKSLEFPTITWSPPPVRDGTQVVEYFIFIEDADTPLSASPNIHGIYYAIPPQITSVTSDSIQKVKKEKGTDVFGRQLSGGFKYAPIGGALSPSKIWQPPNPMRGHGPHRFHFQVLALSGTVDKKDLSQFPSRQSFLGMVEGKVLGWGEWVGVYER